MAFGYYGLIFGIIGTFAFLILFILVFRCYRSRYPNGMNHGMPQLTVIHHVNRQGQPAQQGEMVMQDGGYNAYSGSAGVYNNGQAAYVRDGNQYPTKHNT